MCNCSVKCNEVDYGRIFTADIVVDVEQQRRINEYVERVRRESPDVFIQWAEGTVMLNCNVDGNGTVAFVPTKKDE